ncbi:toxin-antitoxin system YwqK family antitoxin [Pseudomonas sp. P2757]|uniref:toxin-antitoxin system YwqK family antitoxin n=1 Tax=unclassified Pseudomonas TaxID=196821 RepID=UPI003B5C716F
MKWLWLFALTLGIGCSTVSATEFYANKSLAHPLIQGLQESAATLAFIREDDRVKGYYCVCDSPVAEPHLLDDFGAASIESVFLMSLDSEDPTRFVLFRQNGLYKIYAYKYNDNDRLYSRVANLQSALDRITAGQKHLDALTVKKALGRITPLNYRFYYEETGVPEFDQIDFSQGTLVGYYGQYYDPLSDPTPDAQPYFFKKTYQEKDGRFLTVTFWRWLDTTRVEGDRTLYNYTVSRIAWETAPAQFTGSEDGKSVSFYDGEIASRGTYQHGARIGEWYFAKENNYSESGSYVNGVREGKWTEFHDAQYAQGDYRNGLREGRWTLANYDEMDWVATGFETYSHGKLNGPSERTVGGVTERGNYRDGEREGHWVTEKAASSAQ